ncbi:MAG: UDP-3-O-(3-hydroxymyristoyl)glucosamine N-acyltransferase, partial [Acidobacteriota bacterium]|nr:UDP-3-O-(3-hydroxymyristoyl)glucosamine N-acyltransferase [Acidobacteriota bacterium]
MTLADLAAAIGCPFEGDGSLDITRLATIEQAGPGDLTFLGNMKYARALGRTRASAVIVPPELAGAPCAVIRSREPYVSLARAASVLSPPVAPPAGVHPLAAVDPAAVIDATAWIGALAVVESGARIGARTVVHPYAFIGAGATVGPDCVVHAHVSIRERCVLGARVVVQNGAVVGSDGFGFATSPDGMHIKIPQTAPVVIEDDVEIGANTTIDRPAV